MRSGCRFDALQSGVVMVLAAALCVTCRVAYADSPSDAEATANSDSLAEIVVTAEKRSVSLQKTPAAVTAISGEELIAGGVTDLRAAQMDVPSVRFQKEGNSTQVFIRGVGSNNDLAMIEQSVAFNFNGVYVPREGTSTGFFDVASLEVLPGPQGTLYGRSAVGGTVNVSFNRPGFNYSGNALLEVGNFSLVHASVAQNLPVNDTLSFRLAADYIYHDGYNTSGADSQNDWATRFSTLFNPNDAVSLYVWSFYADKKGHPPNLVNKGTDPNTGLYSANAFLNSNPWDDSRKGPIGSIAPFGQPRAEDQTYKDSTTGAQLDWHVAGLTLTYIPSYTYLDSASTFWLGAIPAFISQHYNMTSNELRLSGDQAGVSWIAGVYTYNQHNRGYFIVADAFVNSDVRDNHIKGTGVFGQGTYSITDRLRSTLGVRYSADKRNAEGFQTADPVTGTPILPFSFDRSYSNVDWKIGLELDLTPSVMAYGVVQTGYEPGTYNTAPNTPTFKNAIAPTHLTAFSVGFKSRFLDDRLQLNPEVFLYNYRDLIIQQYDQNVNFNPVFNAQKIRIYGTQLDAIWKVTPLDKLNVNVGYNRARNTEFVTPEGVSYDGLQPPYAPDLTVIASYNHRFPLPQGALVAQLNGRHESSWFADYVHNRGTQQTASTKGDASLTYEAERNWELGLWVKNFTNEAVIAATAAGGVPGPATAYLESPRTYGVRFNVKY